MDNLSKRILNIRVNHFSFQRKKLLYTISKKTQIVKFENIERRK